MLNFSQSHESTRALTVGVSSLDRTSSDSGKPTTSRSGFYRDRNIQSTKALLASVLMVASVGVISLQAGFILNANATGNPITSPVTSQESPSPSPSVSGAPITSPEVSPSPSASPSPSPSAVPSVSPSPSASPSAQPSTEPSVSPSPSIQPSPSPSTAPITSPEVSPSPSVSPSNNGGSNGSSGNSGGGSSNSGGGSPSAPGCDNEAPKSAPKIISALTTDKNAITLTWERAKNPVTSYVITYGLQKGKPLYGNPDIGNTDKYTVKGLSGGTTYYFKVRAGNGCKPGEFSNEIAVKVGGSFLNTPAQGFKPGVLGKANKVSNSKPAPVAPAVINNSVNQSKANTGLVGKVFNFFKNLF